jgi:hypothetical protein
MVDDADKPQLAGTDGLTLKWTRLLAIFTLLLFVASAAADFLIFGQLWASNEDRASSREQLRAVVALDPLVSIVANDKDGKPLARAFQLQFRNLGGTRTASFTAWVSVQYFDGQVPNNVDLSKPVQKVDVAQSAIGPGAILPLAPVTVTEDQAEKAIAKKGVILLWGAAEYADVFDAKHSRHITYCYVMNAVPAVDGSEQLVPSPYLNDCNSST